ncbi:MAG: hypothetical protein J2P46_05065 [Zavarzinella sp.]|nr:hypothetical protein [Zavarzinella sp.]
MSTVSGLTAQYSATDHTVTVTGQAAANATVCVLLNPDLSGISDGQICDRFNDIPALDKKSKSNAGPFSLVLNAGTVVPPNLNVVLATTDGKALRPIVLASSTTQHSG